MKAVSEEVMPKKIQQVQGQSHVIVSVFAWLFLCRRVIKMAFGLSSFFWEIVILLDGIQMECWTEFNCRRLFHH